MVPKFHQNRSINKEKIFSVKPPPLNRSLAHATCGSAEGRGCSTVVSADC